MVVLTVNAGSTSVRLGLFRVEDGKIHRHDFLRHDARPGEERAILQGFVAATPTSITAVIHRVVHAGPHFRRTRVFDAEVATAIERARILAPLHNPAALAWAAASRQSLPDATALAGFDSGFFRVLPAVATTYALPAALAAAAGITRMGFHGFAHQSMSETFQSLRPDGCARVISLQLGGGCSATALRDGQPVDTSMGATPLEGLIMADRPGDLDPGAALQLLQDGIRDAAAVWRIFNEASGLRGLSGLSGDVRVLLEAQTPAATLALDSYAYRIRKYIGAYWAVLGGCDAILVGGGAGEGSPALRARIFRGLQCLGVTLDDAANEHAHAPACISAPDSPVALWIVPTDEETLLAREAVRWWDEAHDATTSNPSTDADGI